MHFVMKFLIKCKGAYALCDEISNKLHRHLCSLICIFIPKCKDHFALSSKSAIHFLY